METVKSGKYENYFLDKCNEYAIAKNKHLVTGHIHYNRQTDTFDNCASAGYQDEYYIYTDSEVGDIAVISDLHLGVKETHKNVARVLDDVTQENINMVVFLGDTFDMVLTNNNDILIDPLFKKLDKLMTTIPCVYIVGNHDINLAESKLNDFLYSVTSEVNIRKYLLANYNVDIVEEFETKNLVFKHGHQFDVNVYKFKSLYLLAFAIGDFINPAIELIDKLLKKFRLGKR